MSCCCRDRHFVIENNSRGRFTLCRQTVYLWPVILVAVKNFLGVVPLNALPYIVKFYVDIETYCVKLMLMLLLSAHIP